MPFEKHISIKDRADYQHTIHHLKMHDTHFAELFDSYHALESQVHNIEKDKSLVKDVLIKSLKKRRLHFRNELFNIIKKLNKCFYKKFDASHKELTHNEDLTMSLFTKARPAEAGKS